MKAMTEQNNRMQIDSMQLTIPRARRRHFYNLRHSGYVTPLVSSSGKTKMAEENGGSRGGGGDELVNRSHRDRAADDLGHRDVTRNFSREL